MSGPLSTNLAGLTQSLSGPSALAAQAAALALQAGVQANQVTLTASEDALPPPGVAGSDALRRSGASVGGFAYAYAFQLTIQNPPTTGPFAGGPTVYSGVLAYEDAYNYVLVQGPFSAPNAGSEVLLPPAIGLIEVSGASGGLWVASAGQELAQINPQSVTSPCTNPCKTLPSYITSCCKADFTNAGFNITASMLFSGGSGSRLAALQNAPLLPGVDLTLDCNQSTLCGPSTSVNSVTSVSISPYSQTVAPNGQVQFTATVAGTGTGAGTGVTWSVAPSSGSGSVTQAGLYTAPNAVGTYTVVATSIFDPTKSGSAEVIVASAPPVTFFNYWGPEPGVPTDYTLKDASGATLSTGNVTFSINELSHVRALYVASVCCGWRGGRDDCVSPRSSEHLHHYRLLSGYRPHLRIRGPIPLLGTHHQLQRRHRDARPWPPRIAHHYL